MHLSLCNTTSYMVALCTHFLNYRGREFMRFFMHSELLITTTSRSTVPPSRNSEDYKKSLNADDIYILYVLPHFTVDFKSQQENRDNKSPSPNPFLISSRPQQILMSKQQCPYIRFSQTYTPLQGHSFKVVDALILVQILN